MQIIDVHDTGRKVRDAVLWPWHVDLMAVSCGVGVYGQSLAGES